MPFHISLSASNRHRRSPQPPAQTPTSFKQERLNPNLQHRFPVSHPLISTVPKSSVRYPFQVPFRLRLTNSDSRCPPTTRQSSPKLTILPLRFSAHDFPLISHKYGAPPASSRGEKDQRAYICPPGQMAVVLKHPLQHCISSPCLDSFL